MSSFNAHAERLSRHPFNVEPPPNVLMKHGFITPASLHYVRNHGAVPKLDWDTHKVKACPHFLISSKLTCCIAAGCMRHPHQEAAAVVVVLIRGAAGCK